MFWGVNERCNRSFLVMIIEQLVWFLVRRAGLQLFDLFHAELEREELFLEFFVFLGDAPAKEVVYLVLVLGLCRHIVVLLSCQVVGNAVVFEELTFASHRSR